MSEFKEMEEKINSVHITESDTSISENAFKELRSNAQENLSKNENDSISENKDVIPDTKGFCSTTVNENEAETNVQISSDIPNFSYVNERQILEENDNVVEIEGSASNTTPDIQELSEQTICIFETEFVRSILFEIRNNLLSECSSNIDVREQILYDLTMKARMKVIKTLTQLSEHKMKLLQQKDKIKSLKIVMLRNMIKVLKNVQPEELTYQLKQVSKETLLVCCQQKEINLRCKSVFKAFLQDSDMKLPYENESGNVLEEQKAYFSMLKCISSKIYILESSINASEDFENCIKHYMNVSTEDPLRRIDLLVDLIDKACYASRELSSFGYELKRIFDCIESRVPFTDE